jgi:3-oxoadipate enol-lactonase
MGQAGFLQVPGARIYYEVEGSGPPVVMIHAGVADLRMWDHQVAALRDSCRVIRYDTRGFGHTGSESVEFSNRDDLAALLDHLGEERVHLVGASRGGSIALDFTIERPERVITLTIAAGGISGYQPPVQGPKEFWERGDELYEAREWERLADLESRYWADGPGQPRDRVPEVRRAVRSWLLSNYRAEKETGWPVPLDPPAADRLHEIRVPLLVLLGTLDDVGTVASMRHLASSVPGARLEELPTAHMINMEQPERFNALLLGHISAHP